MQTVRINKISYLQPDWVEASAIVAGFSTRNGGSSRPPFNSLNLGLHTGDLAAHVEANRAALTSVFALPPHLLLTVNQVHGDRILIIDRPNQDLSHFQRVDADAIVTNQSGMLIGILVADCFPVLLWSRQAGVVAAVHVGWRGAAAGLLGHTVQAMQQQFGVRPERLYAAVGPGIGAHSYEVDRPVRDAFRQGAGNWERIARETRLGHWQLDLQQSCLLQLQAAGVADAHIDLVRECTCCTRETFFSYRRDQGRTGRQMGFIMLRD
ncbi:MAG: peptidoglycan editing factor PgeF [Desulfuromonadales bacterium]|nr:peptidoglycan editing factor PgeF [Desulfuromonadales bacterium]